MMDMSQLTVSRVAEQVGVSPDTLRYYEKIGLMPETERSASGYRLYGDGAVERLRFIKRAQRFGLRLEAIGQLLDIRQRGLCACGRTRRLLEDRVAELDEEMSSLARLRHDICQMIGEPAGSAEPGLAMLRRPGPDQGQVTTPQTTPQQGEAKMSENARECGCASEPTTKTSDECTCGCDRTGEQDTKEGVVS